RCSVFGVGRAFPKTEHRTPNTLLLVVRKYGWRKDDALANQLVQAARAEPGGAMAATDGAVLIDALLLEDENVLQHHHVPLHALHLGDVSDLAAAVPHARLVHDQVERRGDLFADGFRGQLG